MSEARSRRAGGATWSELIGVGFKSLIVDPNCKFLGAAGKRKKEQGFKESCGEDWWWHEGKEWARAPWFTGAKTTFYAYARASLRLRPGNEM